MNSSDQSSEAPEAKKFVKPIDVLPLEELQVIAAREMRVSGIHFSDQEVRDMAYGGYSEEKTRYNAKEGKDQPGHAFFNVKQDDNGATRVYVNFASPAHVAEVAKKRVEWLVNDPKGQEIMRANIQRFSEQNKIEFSPEEISRMTAKPGKGLSDVRERIIETGDSAGEVRKYHYFFDPQRLQVRPVSETKVQERKLEQQEWLASDEGKRFVIRREMENAGIKPTEMEVASVLAGDYSNKHSIVAAVDAPDQSFSKGDKLEVHFFWNKERNQIGIARPETVEQKRQETLEFYKLPKEERERIIEQRKAEKAAKQQAQAVHEPELATVDATQEKKRKASKAIA